MTWNVNSAPDLTCHWLHNTHLLWAFSTGKQEQSVCFSLAREEKKKQTYCVKNDARPLETTADAMACVPGR